MSEAPFDFVLIGATPLARLLAGLLATRHGRRVVFAGESQSAYRLPRGVDLSVAPLTRPESWALLQACLPETRRLITAIAGRQAWMRVDPILFADEAQGKEALAHVRHMALGFGHGAEPVPESAIGKGRDGLLLRDAVLLHRSSLEPALDLWLHRSNVRLLAAGEALNLHADGHAELVAGETRIEIGQTILADDAAIIGQLSAEQWPALLAPRLCATIFTEPTRPVVAPVMCQLDNGVVLVQRQDRGVTAMGPGSVHSLAARLGLLLGDDRDFRQAGQYDYERLVTLDNAPAFGRVGGAGPDILAGLGPTGIFLAPAIARWLAGAANPSEAEWLGARLVSRQPESSTVSEAGGVV